MGYGCGFVNGMIISGYVVFLKKPNLFIKIYGKRKEVVNIARILFFESLVLY